MVFSKGIDSAPPEQTSPADDVAIRLVLQGDKEAFRFLVEAHQDYLFSMLRRTITDPTVARELSQECFIRAYRHLAQFRFESSFRTWLVRIALNCTRSYFSSRTYAESLRRVAWEESQVEQLLPTDVYDPLMVVSLKRAIAALPNELREVILLCGLEQYSYEETADVLEIPVGTVRSRLHRAREQLRTLYHASSQEDG